jgi:hypothetical protein
VHSVRSKDVNFDHPELYFEVEVKQKNPGPTFPRAMEDCRKLEDFPELPDIGGKEFRDNAKLKGMKSLERYACEIRLLGIVKVTYACEKCNKSTSQLLELHEFVDGN